MTHEHYNDLQLKQSLMKWKLFTKHEIRSQLNLVWFIHRKSYIALIKFTVVVFELNIISDNSIL